MTPLYSKTVTREKAQTISTEITVHKGEITFRKQLGEEVTIKKIPFKKGYTFGVNGILLLCRGLKTGSCYTVKTIDEEKCSIEEEKVEILKEELLSTTAGKVPTFLVRLESSAVPGVPIHINIDRKGRIWQSKTMTLITRRCDEKKARQFGRISTYSNRIYVHEKVPVTDLLTRMVFSLSLKNETPGNLLENSPYQTVRLKGKKLEVTLHAVRPPEKLIDAPIKDEKERASYLAPSLRIESTDPGIEAKARSIAGDEPDTMKRIKLLCTWIYQNLVKDDSGISLQSARETLKEGRGDCTEHAVLFCAFARALGIPSRQVCGLIFTGDSFGFHAWAEAWCGRWVPVDATVDRVGLPAAYIELGNDAEGKPGVRSNVKLVKMLNGTSIDITEVAIDGRTLSPGIPSSYIRFENGTCVNLLWDIRVVKPEGWIWKCHNAEEMVIEGPGGSQVTMFPLFIMTRRDHDRIAEDMRRILEKGSGSPVFGTASGRTLGSYTISETPFTFSREERAYSGSTVMLKGPGRKLLFLLFYSPADSKEKNTDDFERILESLSM